MGISRHQRQVFLFLAAILAPAAVLVVLAGRMMVQDRELSAKHAADQRRIEVDQIRRELGARLEVIRQTEINRQMRPAGAIRTQDSASPAVVLSAAMDGDHVVLPWETPSPKESPAFARRRQEGEAAEFARKDDPGAAAAYRLALAAAGSPSESAEARLLLARSLSKSGKADEAFRLYRTLLDAPVEARDEQGVGYRFYAAERLLAAKREPASVAGFLRKTINREDRLTLPELYLIRSLLSDSPPHPVVAHALLLVGLQSEPAVGHFDDGVPIARHVAGLRAKLERDASEPEHIRTVHGVGYKFIP